MLELKNTITELKNTPAGLSSRLDKAEQISELEDKTMEFAHTEQQNKK